MNTIIITAIICVTLVFLCAIGANANKNTAKQEYRIECYKKQRQAKSQEVSKMLNDIREAIGNAMVGDCHSESDRAAFTRIGEIIDNYHDHYCNF